MKLPTERDPILYKTSENETAVIHLTENGRFWVNIRPDDHVLPGEIFHVKAYDDNSFEFDTIDEVQQHLYDSANDDYKKQFE